MSRQSGHGRNFKRRRLIQTGGPDGAECTCSWLNMGGCRWRYYDRDINCPTHGWRPITTVHSPLLDGDDDDVR